MYMVSEYSCHVHSKFCVFDEDYVVSVKFLSEDFAAARAVAEEIATRHGYQEVPAQGQAVVRFADPVSGHYGSVAVLEVPVGEHVGVLAAPVIHAYYAE